ncbi:hypothetical protein JKP88DRAFT_273400 [Tribonema minus]|uniref:Uncharacterized protein n=1 Tax=Tribonema minus TaxID=303371 RepID=A0A835YUN0_9STRA|nr:hypothetical protein JKP88DRAFT_273400 [Tribonema minus]
MRGKRAAPLALANKRAAAVTAAAAALSIGVYTTAAAAPARVALSRGRFTTDIARARMRALARTCPHVAALVMGLQPAARPQWAAGRRGASARLREAPASPPPLPPPPPLHRARRAAHHRSIAITATEPAKQ